MRYFVLLCVTACSFQSGTLPGGDGAMATGDGPPVNGDGARGDTSTMPGAISYVQGAVFTNLGGFSSVSCAFTQPQGAGNFNVIVVSWNDANDMVTSIVDDQGNTYARAVGVSSSFSQSIFYASNIHAGTNTVTVTLSAKVPDPKLRIFEYAGVSSSSSVVDRASSSSGVGSTGKATVNTTNANDLLFSANVVGTVSEGPDPDYTQRQLDAGDLVQDRVVSSTGMYSVTTTLTNASNWVIQLVAFKAQ